MEAQEFLICVVKETQIPGDQELELSSPQNGRTVRMCCTPPKLLCPPLSAASTTARGEDAPWLSRLILQGTAPFVPSLEGMEGPPQTPLSPAPAQMQPAHPQQCFLPAIQLLGVSTAWLMKKNCC